MKCNSFQYRITLLQRSITSFCILDVIAEVIGKEDPNNLVTKQGQESKRLGLLVKDLEKNFISCTLFGSLVDLIQPYLDGDKIEPLISSFDTSNLHINPNVKEAELFKKSLVDSTQSDSYFSSQRISHMSSSSYRSAIDELRKGICKVETIDIVLNASDYCHKKYKKIDERFECDHCHKKAVQVNLRYKLQAYVSDATGRLSATKVRESYSEDDSDDSYA
ncbi:hypothetical protein Ahy_B05g078790 isoform A [Arachis hypogaea]|uniref:Replication factor A C-terminal domain-containing protein n=1 Tax=Arachis hypogaea TaxID=3818 RepID=A0A444Z7Z8_ARAHY|nr:hypothetical protein Ahy_B05g078790 isoform A [Arachis hypogaea]